MSRRKRAGEALRDFLDWIGRAASVTSREEQGRLDADFAVSHRSKEILGWMRGTRRIADMQAAQVDSQGRPSWIGVEIFAEEKKTGVRVSVFYDASGNVMGRAYFDRGNKSSREVTKHLSLWPTLVREGRPRVTTRLPMSEAGLYDKLEDRAAWYCHSEKDGAEYKPTLRDAAEQLVEMLSLCDDPESPEFDRMTAEILRAYDRERARRRKN